MPKKMMSNDANSYAHRAMHRAEVLAQLSSTLPTLTRTYLSKEHAATNTQVGKWMTDAGMNVWQDAVGNICGRYESEIADAPALLLGSHLDTVVNAGKYDGILGVLTALEVVSYLNENQIRLPVAIEVVGFADEEGTRFGVTLLGSKALTGQWEPSWLEAKDANGISIAQALNEFGLDHTKIQQASRQESSICAYLELHIEQGPCLEAQDQALGVVTAINGARRLNCTFKGEAGHAGTVPMMHRKDALVGAAEWIVAIEALTQQNQHQIVATVGSIENTPNAVNVISGKVNISLDIRGSEDQKIDEHLELLLLKAQEIATTRNLEFESREYYRIQATPCDQKMQQKWLDVVAPIQNGQCLSLASGAGHDAIAIAQKWPVSMLFMRCEKGISHNPAEAVKESDVALAIQAYTNFVLAWA